MNAANDQQGARPAERQGPRLALVTGASSGIGFELVRCCLRHRFIVLAVADDPEVMNVGRRLNADDRTVDSMLADLGSQAGVDAVMARLNGRSPHVLMANAGRGLGGGFLDQDSREMRKIINTNVTGTVDLVQRVGRMMRDQGHGRILVTGSIAGHVPGANQAIYNASKAFVNSFSAALRAELSSSGVTVTCLKPGATETPFFDRAGLRDTKMGRMRKDDPRDVAEAGFDAMMEGRSEVIAGWLNRVQAAVANVVPSSLLAEQHKKWFEPNRT